MRRPVLVLLAALAAVPTAAAAQFPVLQAEAIWGPRLRVTPYAGVAPALTRDEERLSFHNTTAAATFDEVEVSVGSGIATGLSVEGRVWERFSLIGSALWVRRGDTREYSLAEGEFLEFHGSDMYVGKAGVAMRLREKEEELQFRSVSAAVFLAPAIVVDEPRDHVFSVAQDRMTMFGLNFGVDAEVPLSDRRFAVQLGLEDFMLWWDDDILSQRADDINDLRGRDVSTFVNADTSHMWLIRLGMSFRFM